MLTFGARVYREQINLFNKLICRLLTRLDRLQIVPFRRELKHARFWDADGDRKWTVFTFNSPSPNHIHIAKYLFFPTPFEILSALLISSILPRFSFESHSWLLKRGTTRGLQIKKRAISREVLLS